jgi:hypothetical protein
MIIENGIVKTKSPGINYYEDPNFQVYFQGVIYIPYIPSGIESIKKILAGIKNHRIDNIENIRGHFFIFIIDKPIIIGMLFVISPVRSSFVTLYSRFFGHCYIERD